MSTAPDHMMQERTLGATLMRASLCLLIIACGLALRRFGPGLGLAFPLVKYGGSILWGTMVFFLVAMAARARSQRRIALISVAIAVFVELFRLVHIPWLDDFRLTTAGALLLGRVFSPWNMLAYGVGIGLGMGLDRFGIWAVMKTRLSAPNAPHSPS
jgi:Protein of unknown function (DUF2809)